MRPAAAKLKRWREHPGAFVRECLGASPDAWQDEVLEAFGSGAKRIALKASKGPGKSTVLAWIIWLFLATRPHPKVAATSISGDNLRDGLWTELAKWMARSPFLQAAFRWSKERIVSVDHPETWWAAARQWARDADPTQQADTLAGLHADYILFVIDEAGGVPDAVAAAAEAALATGIEARLVIAGNPTHLSGPLYRASTSERRLWWVKEISGDPDDPRRASRVDIGWAREQIEKYGRDSPYVLVNVLGQFPPGQSNSLISLALAEEASRRTLSPPEYLGEARVVGVDVARFGDDRTVIAMRQGRAAYQLQEYRDLDTMQVAGRVGLLIGKWRPHAVFVDQTGVGAGVVDRLRQLGHAVMGVDNGGAALRPEPKLADRRAEQWWELAQWLKDGGCIPDDGELRAELAAPTYRFDPKGRLRLESKDELKKRGLQSPDKADALALTFAGPVAVPLPQHTPRKAFARPGGAPDWDYDPHAEVSA